MSSHLPDHICLVLPKLQGLTAVVEEHVARRDRDDLSPVEDSWSKTGLQGEVKALEAAGASCARGPELGQQMARIRDL